MEGVCIARSRRAPRWPSATTSPNLGRFPSYRMSLQSCSHEANSSSTRPAWMKASVSVGSAAASWDAYEWHRRPWSSSAGCLSSAAWAQTCAWAAEDGQRGSSVSAGAYKTIGSTHLCAVLQRLRVGLLVGHRCELLLVGRRRHVEVIIELANGHQTAGGSVARSGACLSRRGCEAALLGVVGQRLELLVIRREHAAVAAA